MPHALHITYSGPGGMTQAVLTLLDAASDDPSQQHSVLFFGTEPVPERLTGQCAAMGVAHRFIQKRPGNDFASLLQVFGLLQELRPDVVYSHMTQPLPALLCYRLARPETRLISIEHHSNALKSRQDWLLTCANHILSDHSVYLTPQYREEIRNRLHGLFRPGKVSVIPNGLDTVRFRPLPDAPDAPHAPGIRIGMVARMVPGKDFETLLRAFRSVLAAGTAHPVRLQLAGDGPMRQALAGLARDLGIAASVDFLGELAQESLIPVMQSWQIFVLSTFGETMSRSIMEAQALGLAIVSTRVPGVIAAIEPGKTGLLVEAGNPEEMAEALLRLLNSPSLRGDLGRQAREVAVESYSSAEIWRRYDALTQSLFSN